MESEFLKWFEEQYGKRPAKAWETRDGLIAEEDAALAKAREVQRRREALAYWEDMRDVALKGWNARSGASY